MSVQKTPYAPDNQTRLPTEHYLKLFAGMDPEEISERTGAAFENGTFTMTVLGEKKTVTWPDFYDEGYTSYARILLLRYLLEGKRTKANGVFLTYREMPWGEVYDRNFNGRCIMRLSRTFGTKIEDFRIACESFGGLPVRSSGVGYELCFLPGLYLRFFVWEGEDDIPASAQIQFSDNFPDAFSAEDRVVVCEYVIGKLRDAVKK